MAIRGRGRRPDAGERELSVQQLTSVADQLVETETREDVRPEAQEAFFHQLEQSLHDSEQELIRLRQLTRRAPAVQSEEARRAIALAEEEVVTQEQRVTDYLEQRPWLQERLEQLDESEPAAAPLLPQTPEPDWRNHLANVIEEKRQSWTDQLQSSQARLAEAWLQREKGELEQRYAQLESEVRRRQRKLEQEWSGRLEQAEFARFRQWLAQETQSLAESLTAEKSKLEEGLAERQRQSIAELEQGIREVADEIVRHQQAELRQLELEWREQELLLRERPGIERRWAELAAEQRQHWDSWASAQQEEIRASLTEMAERWTAEQANNWVKLQTEWLERLRQDQEQATLQRWSAEQEQLNQRASQLLNAHQAELLQEQANASHALQQFASNWRDQADQELADLSHQWREQQAQMRLEQSELLQEVERTAADWQMAANRQLADSVAAWQQQQLAAQAEQQALLRDLLRLAADWQTSSNQLRENWFAEWCTGQEQSVQLFLERWTAAMGGVAEQWQSDWSGRYANQLEGFGRRLRQCLEETDEALTERFAGWVAGRQSDLAELERRCQLAAEQQVKLAKDELQITEERWREEVDQERQRYAVWLSGQVADLTMLSEQVNQDCRRQLEQGEAGLAELRQGIALAGQVQDNLLAWQEQFQQQMAQAAQSWVETAQAHSQQFDRLLADLQDQYRAEQAARSDQVVHWLQARSGEIEAMHSQLEEQSQQELLRARAAADQQLAQLRDEWMQGRQQSTEALAQQLADFSARTAEVEALLQGTSGQLQQELQQQRQLQAESREQLQRQFQQSLQEAQEAGLQQASERLSRLEQLLRTAHQQQLAELTERHSHQFGRELAEQAGQTISAYRAALEAASNELRGQQVALQNELRAAGKEGLQQLMTDANRQFERVQQEQWGRLVVEMLSRQKQELTAAVETSDQRLLGQLRAAISSEVQAELGRERQARLGKLAETGQPDGTSRGVDHRRHRSRR